LIQRFKIEDDIFLAFGVEVEHFILLRHEEQKNPQENDE